MKRKRHAYETCADALDAEFMEGQLRHKRRHQFIPMYERMLAFEQRNEQSGVTLCGGDLRLKKIRERLDSLKMARSADQFEFHELFIKLCLPQIYGADFEPNRQRLMDAFGLDNFKVGAYVVCPRRWGKSISVGMFIYAMMLECMGIVLALFSPTQKQATMLLQIVERFIHENDADAKRILKSSGGKHLAVATVSALQENGEFLYTRAQMIKSSGTANHLFAYSGFGTGTTFCVCF